MRTLIRIFALLTLCTLGAGCVLLAALFAWTAIDLHFLKTIPPSQVGQGWEVPALLGGSACGSLALGCVLCYLGVHWFWLQPVTGRIVRGSNDVV